MPKARWHASKSTDASHAYRSCRLSAPSPLRFCLESAAPFPCRNPTALGVATSKGHASLDPYEEVASRSHVCTVYASQVSLPFRAETELPAAVSVSHTVATLAVATTSILCCLQAWHAVANRAHVGSLSVPTPSLATLNYVLATACHLSIRAKLFAHSIMHLRYDYATIRHRPQCS